MSSRALPPSLDLARRKLQKDGFLRACVVWIPGIIAVLLASNAEVTLLKYGSGMLFGPRLLTEKVKTLAVSIYDAGMITANSIQVFFDRQQVDSDSPLPSILLRVQPGSLEEMASNLPNSAKAKLYPARLRYPDGQWRKVKYRFRGRNIWHWDPVKPSLRVKLDKNLPIDLLRNVNLINPEDRPMVANILGEEIASRLGVLTPQTKFVRLFINDDYRGVYHWTTNEEERWLRSAHRVPGAIFIGDHLDQQWLANGFTITGEIDVLKDRNPMQEMIDAMERAPGPERYRHLWKVLSFNKYARWHAAMSVAGSTHTDYTHNNTFYYDPSAGLIEPVTSDINGHGMLHFPVGKGRLTQPFKPDYRVPINEKLQPLLDVALRDPRFLHHRNEVLYHALLHEASPEAQQAILSGYYMAIDRDVYADHRKAALMEISVGWWRVPYSNRQYEESKKLLSEWIVNRQHFLLDELRQCTVRVSLDASRSHEKNFMLVEIDGNAAVRFDPARLGVPVTADTALDGTGTQRVTEPLLLYPGLREDARFYYLPTEGRRVPKYYLRPAPQRYLFLVSSADKSAVTARVAEAFTHSLTGELIHPEVVSQGHIDPTHITYNTTSVHIWRFPQPPTQDIVLGPGDVELASTLEVAPTQHLRVQPGTRIRLGENVSILARGQVQMVGAKDRPIVLERLEARKPWGGLVIHGDAASGSQIAYAKISGGSLPANSDAAYLGMVNIQWVTNVSITHVSLGGNVISDDTIHLIHSQSVLDDLQFSRCFADCIDVDYGDAAIRRISVDQAGNDGIDLMTARVAIQDYHVNGAKDKGISCGEQSDVDIDGAVIEHASIGVAPKDASRVRLRNSILRHNGIAVDIYRKNLAYGGPGSMDVTTTTFEDNEVDLKAEEGARVLFHGQPAPLKRWGSGQIEAEEPGAQ